MRRSEKFANPFYGLLLVAGILFALTATVYGVMAVRQNSAPLPLSEEQVGHGEHPLMVWMSAHGDMALAIELSVLAVGTFGAIATDDYWQRRAARQRNSRQF